jgi:hypothetical protein
MYASFKIPGGNSVPFLFRRGGGPEVAFLGRLKDPVEPGL